MARTMLRYCIEKSCGTIKEAARRLNYSPEMLSKILAGERNIAPEIRVKMARMHPLAGLALALEATGYKWFSYIEGDRHPQNLIQRVLKEDEEADKALEPIPKKLIDKTGLGDLTDEDIKKLRAAAKEISEDITAKINLLIEWEDRYQIGLLDLLVKEKSPANPRINVKYAT